MRRALRGDGRAQRGRRRLSVRCLSRGAAAGPGRRLGSSRAPFRLTRFERAAPSVQGHPATVPSVPGPRSSGSLRCLGVAPPGPCTVPKAAVLPGTVSRETRHLCRNVPPVQLSHGDPHGFPSCRGHPQTASPHFPDSKLPPLCVGGPRASGGGLAPSHPNLLQGLSAPPLLRTHFGVSPPPCGLAGPLSPTGQAPSPALRTPELAAPVPGRPLCSHLQVWPPRSPPAATQTYGRFHPSCRHFFLLNLPS